MNFFQNDLSAFYAVIKPKNNNISNNIDFNYNVTSINGNNLIDRCRLFNDLCVNNKELNWKELLGLLSNISNVQMKFNDTEILATTFMLDHIQEQQKELYKILVKFIRPTNLGCINCSQYCPYKHTCYHAKTMIDTVYIKKDHIVKLDKEENYITLDEARKELNVKAERLYNKLLNKKIDMGLLIAQTGTGKTEKVIELIIRTVENGKGCIYAVPNRDTIDEFIARIEEKGFFNYLVTPKIDDLEDKKIRKEVNYLQTIGAYNTLKKYLHKLLKKNKEGKIQLLTKDKEKIENYFKINKEIKKFDGLIITTHKRFPFLSEETYIDKIAFVDEDIFDTDFVSITTMPINKVWDIIKASPILNSMEEDWSKIEEIEKLKDNIVTPINWIEFNNTSKEEIEKELINMRKNPVNIFDFYSCCMVKKYFDGYKYKIKCFNFRQMPDIPIFITSATAKREFYDNVFKGNRKIKIQSVSNAKYEGKIKLYDSHTYSKEFMRKEENLEYFINLIELCKNNNMNLVTFKEFIEKNKTLTTDDDEIISKPMLLDEIKCYNFFSILGLDELKDNDLAVIGKPLKDDDIFYFLAYLIYNKEYSTNQRCQSQIVEDNGFIFQLYTYLDEFLKKIQMWSISSNEEQYVGRARVIGNKDRIAYLASGYPVEQMIIDDED